MLTRRQIVAGAAVTALAAPAVLRAQSWFQDYPFALGVAAGDPAPDGFVIWTKIAPDPMALGGGAPLSPLPVQWEVASDDRFGTIVQKGEAIAWPQLGHSVHVEVTGLTPNRPYWYRFNLGRDRSMRGRAWTLPVAGSSPDKLRFGVAGCQHYEDGFYTAYRHLAEEQDIAFVFHYGDFIYEYRQDYETDKHGLPAPPVRRHALRELYSVDDYRRHYGQYLLDMDLQAARSAHAFLQSFDDHEVHNDWVGNADWQQYPGDPIVPPEIFALRRQAAMQAWYEHMPVRGALLPRHGDIVMQRRFQVGDLATINVLDTRSYRSDQPCGDGFKPRCAEVGSPDAQVMGKAQEDWFAKGLSRSVRWNCVAQQVMVMPLDRRRVQSEPEKILNLDSWAGYDGPRERLIGAMKGFDNCVVLTGDEHQNFAGLLLDKDKPVAVEFVSTSITSGGDGSDLRPGSDVILANNPQLKFVNDQRGYVTCDVGRDEWRTNFMVLDKVSVPGLPISKRQTISVARGEPGLALV